MERRIIKTRITTALLMLGLTLAGASQAASMYKWTDADGNVHYSQTPPESTTESETMVIRGSGQKRAAPSSQVPENNGSGIPPVTPRRVEKDPRAIEQRTKNCETARKNLEVYKSSRAVRQSDGTEIILSDEMRKAKIEETTKQIETFCR